jgi:hypothetical protein
MEKFEEQDQPQLGIGTDLETNADPSGLDASERERLRALEEIIGRGMNTFLEVGKALSEVRGGRLYRGSHASFEEYVRERWGFQRAQTYRLIAAAEVTGGMSPRGDAPTTEAQARALSRLSPPQRDAVAAALAAEGGFAAVTARRVAEVARQVAPSPVSRVRPRAERRAIALVEVMRALSRDAEKEEDRVVEVINWLAARCGPEQLEALRLTQRVLLQVQEQAERRSGARLSLLCPTCGTVPPSLRTEVDRHRS